jgi:hypothetical protein
VVARVRGAGGGGLKGRSSWACCAREEFEKIRERWE